MKSTHKRLIYFLLLAFIAVAGIFWYLYTKKFPDTRDSKADFTVNAIAFIREFEKDNDKANKKYTEKIVSVSGRIAAIEQVDTTANIKFTDPVSGSYIIFSFQDQHLNETKGVKAGDSVTIKGSCSGGIFSEILGTEYISFKRSTLKK